jgi:hypothetical protein
MDTDDLSDKSYQTIVIAKNIHDDLKTVIGASSYEYRTEEEFLKGNLHRIEKLIENPLEFIEYWDLYEEIEENEFRKKLKELREHIVETLSTPIDKRNEI